MAAPNNISPTVSTKNKVQRKRKFKAAYPSFSRNVILLSGPDINKTLTGRKKAIAFSKGLGLNAVKFEKEWDQEHIYKNVRKVFAGVLPDDIDFELLMPMSGIVVSPALPPGDKLDGYLLNNVFTQKTIYVRPKQHIHFNNTHEKNETDDEADFTDTDISVVNTEVNTDLNLLDESSHISNSNYDADEQQLESDTYIAIQNSLQDNFLEETKIDQFEKISEAQPTLESILFSIRSTLSTSESCNFNIDRSNVLQCCVRAMKRSTFSPFNRVSVMFTDVDGVSEEAVDWGGPTREMWRLVLKELKTSNIFEGSENEKVLSLNSDNLQKRMYYEAGRIISMSLVHGGPGPRFLSPDLYRSITEGVKNITGSICDVHDADVKQQIENISSAENLEQLHSALLVANTLLTICGCSTYANNFQKKDDIVKSVLQFYVVDRVRQAFKQFEKGLKTLGLLNHIKACPLLFKQTLCYFDEILLSETVRKLFKITYSEVGSNKREIENLVVGFWRDYLQDLEEKETTATLSDVLQFATGADVIPPLGFSPNPTITFLHGDSSKYPKANTCGLVLQLPVIHSDYEKFREDMDYGIQNGMVFAFA